MLRMISSVNRAMRGLGRTLGRRGSGYVAAMGSAYFPITAEGRVLCLALALYGFAVFGYVTATLATFFVARDAPARALPP